MPSNVAGRSVTEVKHQQRRRIIKLMACGAALCGAPGSAMGGMLTAMPKEGRLHEWRGFALGAEVSLQIYHDDKIEADGIIYNAVSILREMERLFSLYDDDSVLSQLNREGKLLVPPQEFHDLLSKAADVSRQTAGAFDITVQPLWRFYKTYFSKTNFEDKKALDEELPNIHNLVGYERLHITKDIISFDQVGMAVTLNGIAQGYVTDKVSDYLKGQGLTSVLVDLGEFRALGPQADNSPWRIAVADPVNFGHFSEVLDVTKGAVATSSGLGDTFDTIGKFHHILDPHNGKSPQKYLSVTVLAPEATMADALSTAFFAMSEDDIKDCIGKMFSVQARIIKHDGNIIII